MSISRSELKKPYKKCHCAHGLKKKSIIQTRTQRWRNGDYITQNW